MLLESCFFVYVGLTAKSPDNPIATRKEAEYKEALQGKHLRKRGFAVWWD